MKKTRLIGIAVTLTVCAALFACTSTPAVSGSGSSGAPAAKEKK